LQLEQFKDRKNDMEFLKKIKKSPEEYERSSTV